RDLTGFSTHALRKNPRDTSVQQDQEKCSRFSVRSCATENQTPRIAARRCGVNTETGWRCQRPVLSRILAALFRAAASGFAGFGATGFAAAAGAAAACSTNVL